MNEFYKTIEWVKLKERVFAYHGVACVLCGCSDKNKLTAHHLTYKNFGGNEEMEDMQVLCHPCHQDKTIGYVERLKNYRGALLWLIKKEAPQEQIGRLRDAIEEVKLIR